MNPAARLVALLLMLAAALPVAAQNQSIYVTTLSGSTEIPPNASTGTGSASVTLDLDARSMRVQVSFSDLLSITTVAHIHCCTPTANTGGTGVATQLPTFDSFPAGVTSGKYDRTFDMTLASSYNPAFITAWGTPAGAFSELNAAFASGRAYLNIHTEEFPLGEIRGFLAPVPEPSTWALLLAGVLGMSAVVRLRRA